MACLYNPYSFSRVAEGGFCDPVRILLTVLSAWLNTLSIFPSPVSMVYRDVSLISYLTRTYGV